MTPRRLAALLVAALLVPWFSPSVAQAAPHPAPMRDGLDVTSTTTYVVDPDAGVVHVLAEMEFTNTLPDLRDGYYITRRYFTGFSLPVPVDAINAVATRVGGGGVEVTPRLVPEVTAWYVLDVDFGPNLFYGQTARVNVTYDIPGLDPRSELPSRVNLAYAAFDAFGIGDQGEVTVKVVVPPGFEVETFGDASVSTDLNGYTIYTATEIQEPDEFDIFISARNDDQLTHNEITLESGGSFDVRAWPDDPEWETFVVEQIEQGVPALEELIGQDWPIDSTVEVREAYTPFLYGYAGWFNGLTEDIEIDEELDAEVVLHEISHAWFNNDWMAERWISEGFAQVYSNAVLDDLGGDTVNAVTPRRTDPGFVRLNQWDNPADDDSADDIETYGYNAAYYVVQELYDEIGPDGMKAVLEAIASEDIAYQGEDDPELGTASVNWKRFLDLVEEIGGATEAQSLFEDWVLTSAEAGLLEDRAGARDDYHALVDAGGEWATPVGVRQAMARWEFEQALELMGVAGDVLAARDDLDAVADDLGEEYPDTFETDYQAILNEDDAAALTDSIEDQAAAAEELLATIEAEAADDGFFGGIGLMGTNLPALIDDARQAWRDGDLDAARAAMADVTDTLGGADDKGKTRVFTVLGIAFGVLLLIGLLWWWLRRRRRARRAAAALAAQPPAEGGVVGADGTVLPYDPTLAQPAPAYPADGPDGGGDGEPELFSRDDEPTHESGDGSGHGSSDDSSAADPDDSDSGSSDSGTSDSGTSDSGSSDSGGGDCGGGDGGGD